MSLCPCGSGLEYSECCEPYIKGEKDIETAEALLRARYSAHALSEVEFIYNSVHADKKNEHSIKGIEKWASESKWLGLNILNTEKGQPDDNEGIIEFQVKYNYKFETFNHHEISYFKKDEGKWFFYDGEPVKPKQIKREEPKVGRNDPCPCGSGKKYKKCCLK